METTISKLTYPDNILYRDKTATFSQKITFPEPETIDENKLPPVSVYILCLDEICKREEIDKETARTRYGLYTYKQWKDLLNPYRAKDNDKPIKTFRLCTKAKKH